MEIIWTIRSDGESPFRSSLGKRNYKYFCLLQSVVPRSMRFPSSTVSQVAVTRLDPLRTVVLDLWVETPHGITYQIFILQFITVAKLTL